jgi:replicative DNA helicase
MAKLYSAKTEAIAIRALCSRDTTVAGYVFSMVDEGYFYNKEAVEAYRKIHTSITRKGTPPAFRLLCEDVSLSEDARSFISNADTAIKGLSQAEQLVTTLDKYRKTRGMYKLAAGILNKLEGSSIDVDSTLEMISRRVAKISTKRSLEDTIWHIGRDSNIRSIIEELLYGENNDNVIPTGLKTFDTVNGGFFRSALVVVGGSSGAGKCNFSNTEISLSTLRFDLEDGSTFEAEPWEYVLVYRENSVEKEQVSHLKVTDDLVIDADDVSRWLAKVCVEENLQLLPWSYDTKNEEG